MKIGIIGPSENEIMPFIYKIENKKTYRHAMIDFHCGRYSNIAVVAAFSGVCKVNAAIATQILIDKFDVTHVVLIGVAGALDESLQIGDIIIAKEVAYHDVAKEILTEYHPWMEDIYFRTDSKMIHDIIAVSKAIGLENRCYIGRVISGEAFITENERFQLIERFEPSCVDMESASVAHVCYANNVPFLVIRGMSDFANENGSETFEDNMEAVALHCLLLVENLLKHYGEIKAV
jgi:adenosylhomocysteine nucleosidase